jgi:TRAP-type C4-dicarboxylate transport system permease small subunit
MSGRSGGLFVRAVENVLIVGFAAMIALVFGNVVMRYVFNSGIIAAEEVSRMIFVWLTFGGAYLVARENGHLGMNSLVIRLGQRGRWICRFLTEAMSLFCMVLVAIGCWEQTRMNLTNAAPVTGLPTGIVYAAGLACGVGLASINIRNLFLLLTGRIAFDDLVPQIETEEMLSANVPRQDNSRS